MPTPRALALVLGCVAGIGAGWACGAADCGSIYCGGGFRYDLRVDGPDTEDVRLEITAEGGRSTWACPPKGNRCMPESSEDGDRDFDIVLTMAGSMALFNGTECDATVCIRMEIRGKTDDPMDPGTYGPESVTVRIIGGTFVRQFEPEYERTEDYGGVDCPYCDSLESFEDRAQIN